MLATVPAKADQNRAKNLGKQYAHTLLNVPSPLPPLTSQTAIGVIDTDIDNTASLRIAQFKKKRFFIADNEIPALSTHGNAIASILAATGNGFEGLAQGLRLYNASIMREVGSRVYASNTLLAAQALNWLRQENVSIANISLSGADDAILAYIIRKSQDKGIAIAAAAGNGGVSAPPSYPAAYAGVIAVTAIDAQKNLYTSANRGSYISLAAPGVDVWLPNVVVDGTKHKATYVSGTSFATPFVSAAIARIMNKEPLSQVQTWRSTLCQNALSLGTQTKDYGCGLLQFSSPLRVP